MKERPQPLVDEMRQVGDRIKLLEADHRQLEEQVNSILLELPNLPADDVPQGLSEEDNVLIRTWGEVQSFDFTPLPHWDLGEALGIIDFQKGTRMAGSRFFIMRGMGAKLERALISWMLDLHTNEHSYEEVYLPAMVKREIMEGSGTFPSSATTSTMTPKMISGWCPPQRSPSPAFTVKKSYPPAHCPCTIPPTHLLSAGKTAAGRDTRGIKRSTSSIR